MSSEERREQVNHPRHYNTGSIECITIIRNMGFDLGSVVKYLWRFEHKNKIEDLEKSQWYLRDLKEHHYLTGMFNYVPLDPVLVSEIVKEINNPHIADALSSLLHSLHFMTPLIIDSIIKQIENGIKWERNK